MSSLVATRSTARIRRASPASRAKQRRQHPALSLPPVPPPMRRRQLREELELKTATTRVRIGPNIVGEPISRFALGEAASIQMSVFDPFGQVIEALTDQLAAVDGARVDVDGIVYVVQDFEGKPSNVVDLLLEDEVAWRLRIYRSFRAFPRSRFNRAQAFRELVREAGTSPMTPIRAWIPELRDRQRVAPTPVERDGGPTTEKGVGRDGNYFFKGQKATTRQRRVFNETMAECRAQGASRRVMIATAMMKTQESRMGEDTGKTGNDDIGDSQQGREWISETNAKDPRKTTRAFLLGDEAKVGGTGGVRGWKQRNGSLRNAPGNLDAAITAVQISVGGYGVHEAEQTKNVDQWLGGAGASSSEPAVYEFTRGDRDGQRETSWACSGRWAEEVRWKRSAMLNTACWASEDEMRAGAIALWIDGTEPWLQNRPRPKMGATRAANEVTFDVLAERWAILPGAAVTLERELGALYGRWLVDVVEGPTFGDTRTVTLKRPVEKALEPAIAESAGGDSETGGSSSYADRLYDACKQISDQGRSYLLGGGHGPPLKSVLSTRGPLDCSSSCSLAVWMAGMFEGDVAIVSGAFASSWGTAGKGKHFTVWANAGHVWIEFHGGARDGHRFDTSPQGSGSSGPRLRTKPRSHDGFTARHRAGQ